MYSSSTFFVAFLGGILPSILWLLFWLREDRLEPEPRQLIVSTFTAGMVATLVALAVENIVHAYLPAPDQLSGELYVIPIVMVWATIEEVCKYSAAYLVALRRRDNDQPVDNMIYLITAALGFAAVENSLFLLDPVQSGDIIQSLVTGDLRFIGSTLLHLVSSATIGIFLAFAFCKLPSVKKTYTIIGVILAIILHTFFNFFILKSNNNLFAVFGFVWIGVIVLLLFFERVKRINRSCVF